MAAIDIECPKCGKKLRLAGDVSPGTRAKCPRCARIFPLPNQDVEPLEVLPADVVRRRPVPVAELAEEEADGPRERPQRREDAEEAFEDDRPRRRRPAPSGGGMSVGLIIGLAAVVVVFFLIAAGVGVYLLVRPGPIAWQEFTPPGAFCRIDLPETPQEQSLNLPNNVPGVEGKKYVTKPDRTGTAFALAYASFPEETLRIVPFEQFVKLEREAMVQATKSEVVAQTDIRLDGHTGKEFQLKVSNGREMVIERVYLVHSGTRVRLYMLVAAGPRIKPNSPETTHFFDSFKLLDDGRAAPREPAPAAPPATKPKPAAPPVQPEAPPEGARPVTPPAAPPGRAPRGPATPPGFVPPPVTSPRTPAGRPDAGRPIAQQPPDANAIRGALADLDSTDRRRRWDAAKLLARATPDEELRAEVLKALEARVVEEIHYIRKDIFRALGIWGTAETVPLLIRCFEQERDVFAHSALMEALGRSKDPRAAEALAPALGELSTRHDAEEALKAIGPAAQAATLKVLKSGRDVFTKASACSVLGSIGTGASIVPLKQAANGKEAFVQLAAKKALMALEARGIR